MVKHSRNASIFITFAHFLFPIEAKAKEPRAQRVQCEQKKSTLPPSYNNIKAKGDKRRGKVSLKSCPWLE